MPNLSRFERDLEVDESSVEEPTSRFERLDSELDLVYQRIRDGHSLTASLSEGLVLVSLEALASGSYPTLQLGLTSLGEQLKGDPVEVIAGPGIFETPADQYLLNGGTITCAKWGTLVRATLTKDLPPRAFEYKGKTYEVYRIETRHGIGLSILKAIEAAIVANPNVTEGSLAPG